MGFDKYRPQYAQNGGFITAIFVDFFTKADLMYFLALFIHLFWAFGTTSLRERICSSTHNSCVEVGLRPHPFLHLGCDYPLRRAATEGSPYKKTRI
jgi:hypothetical protein